MLKKSGSQKKRLDAPKMQAAINPKIAP